jgi:hypothetical protein
MGRDDRVVYDYAENPVLHVYELTDTAEAKVYTGKTGDKEAKLSVKLDRRGREIKMTANAGHGGFALLFHNMKADIDGHACETTPQGTAITVPAGCTSLVFAV